MHYRYFILTGIFLFFSCTSKKNDNNIVLKDLLNNQKNKIFSIVSDNGKINEIRDKGIDDDTTSGGIYAFYPSGGLKLYLFLDRNTYNYSEEFDPKGKLIKSKGYPLVDYRVVKRRLDSTFFAFFFFCLNKKYEQLQIFSGEKNFVDTVLMGKSKYYTNMKCVMFGMPNPKRSDILKIYTRAVVYDTCSNFKIDFTDTAFFKIFKNNLK